MTVKKYVHNSPVYEVMEVDYTSPEAVHELLAWGGDQIWAKGFRTDTQAFSKLYLYGNKQLRQGEFVLRKNKGDEGARLPSQGLAAAAEVVTQLTIAMDCNDAYDYFVINSRYDLDSFYSEAVKTSGDLMPPIGTEYMDPSIMHTEPTE